MVDAQQLNDHDPFRELAAGAALNALTSKEWTQFREHSQACSECSEAYQQYLVLVSEGLPLLAVQRSREEELETWDDRSSRKNIFDRIRSRGDKFYPDRDGDSGIRMRSGALPRGSTAILSLAHLALAACLVGAVGLTVYLAGIVGQTHVKKAVQVSAGDGFQSRADRKTATATSERPDIQTEKIQRLQDEVSSKEQDLAKIHLDLRTLEERDRTLVAAANAADDQSQNVSQQRDALSGQLRDLQRSYSDIQGQLTSLRSERDEALTRAALLESRVSELSTTVRSQERRISDQEQFLASDRDIRELMGARNLYIADVFDVDSHSLTRKPFGRVFYTQSKSLIFYAFDLGDQEGGVKDANAFQVWGSHSSDETKPLSLGILYMDSESKRRWVLRFDNPKQLAEIDAVFVTVEPRGGSRKPTGKPFLYALLRREANHP